MSNWVITARTGESPLSLANAKANLKVEHADEDTLIQAKIDAAYTYLESFLGVILNEATVNEYFDGWPAVEYFELRFKDVSSQVVTYYDTDNAEQTYSTDNYSLDDIHEPARIIKNPELTWPDLVVKKHSVKVAYTAGYASASVVPARIIEAIQLMVADAYERREDRAFRFKPQSEYYSELDRLWAF